MPHRMASYFLSIATSPACQASSLSPQGPGTKPSVTFNVCVCPPSPGLILVRPPDTALLTGWASGPSPRRLPPGKCGARCTEAFFSFCSIGRGRLRLRQHHVSRGSALSEGKGPWALQLPGGSAGAHKASSGQPGGGTAERTEPGWREQPALSPASGPEGGPRGAPSGGPPSSPVDSQGWRTPPEGLVRARVLLLQTCWVSWVPLLQESHVGVGGKEAAPLGTPAAGVPVSKLPFSSPCTPFLLSHGLDQLGSSPKLSAPLGAWPEVGLGSRGASSPDSVEDACSSGPPLLQRRPRPWSGFWGTGGGRRVSPWGNLRRYCGGKATSTGSARTRGARGCEASWEGHPGAAAVVRGRGSMSRGPARLRAPALPLAVQSSPPGSPPGFSPGSLSWF